jgi:hypothetical protein
MPPPAPEAKGSRREPMTSGMRPRKPATPTAFVDEVTADLSKDPRREK